MKKLLLFAALVLGMASCQTEPEGLDVVVGGEQEVMLSVSLPESTRSKSSAGFDFTEFEKNSDYDLRFILEISHNGKVDRTVNVSKTTSTTFPIRLAPERDYTFTVWADIVEENSQEDLYYNILTPDANGVVPGLSNITIKEWTPNVELRDAYTFTTTKEFKAGATDLTMTLERPFAKVRVVATDIEDVTKFDIVPDKATVTYTVDMYTKYNAVGVNKGASEVDQNVSITYPIDVNAYEDEKENGQLTELTVFADYIFVPADGIIKFDLVINDGDAKIKENYFNTAIPVVANKVTSIVGDVLTHGGNVSINVNSGIGQNETINYVDSATTLQEIINDTADNEIANITLGGDIDLGDLLRAGTSSTRAAEPTYGLLIPAGKSVVLDLKGFTISQSKTQTAAYSMIDNRGTLTIKDDSANKTGKISYADNGQGGNYGSNTINNSGVLTIDGGTIENNSSATVASNGFPHPIDNSGTLVINDGTFTNNANYSSMRIWCTTDDNTIITINGGTFNGSIDFQTPNASANKGTLTINGGTFNADTYTKCAVRLLGFGADVDEMNGYILGGHFNGAIALKNWTGSELNSKVFDITAGTFTTEAKDGTDIALLNDEYTWAETENGLWTVALKNVIAKIGEVEYRTLQKAFDAVDNDTIVLQDNVTLNAPAVLAAGKTATLDLNGKTITTAFVSGSTTNHAYAFENRGTMTIMDSSNGNGKIVARGNFNYGTMTLVSGTIDACDGNGGYGVRNYEGAKFVMNGGAIVTSNEDDNKVDKGGYDATTLRIDEGATAEINDGIINNICDYTFAIDNYGATTVNGGTITSIHSTVSSYGNMTIKGGSFTCDGLEKVTAHALVAWDGSETNIYGGTFDGKDNYNGFNVDACAGALVNISGGKFLPVHSGSLYGEGTIIVKGGTFFDQIAESRIDSDYKLVERGENWVVEKKPAIAKIGEVGYTSLAKAVAAVEDGETINLVANEVFTEKNYYDNGGWKDGLGYAGDKSFTIDLGGYTISQNGALNDYLLWFKNVGSKANTITIKNGTLDAGTTAYCALCTASSHDNKLTINLEDVNLINNISNGSTVRVRAGSVLNVNAGTKITGKDSYLAIENYASTVNIYDGAELYMNGTTSYNGCLAGVAYGGTINVYGGYGKGVKGGFIAMTSGGTINIYGGEWIANTDGTIGNNSNLYVLTAQSNKYESGFVGGSYINVSGGTFLGGMDAWVLNNIEGEDAKLSIYGGNFNANPASYLVPGFSSVKDGEWYRVKAVPSTVTGECDYNGAEIVITAAPENNGIICPEGTTTIKNLTIDGGNFKTIDGKGLRGVYVTKETDLTLDNVVIKNVTYAINVNTTKSVKLTVKNSTLEGWTSYGQTTTATFENVQFECGEYANFKPYSDTTLTNCSFEADFQIDFTSLNGVITLKNCTYNGVVLTAENFATVAKFEGDITGKIAF